MLYKIYVFLYLNEPTFSCVFSCIYMEKERERDKFSVPEWIKSISVMRVSSHEVQTGLWVRCSGFLEELGESLVREVTWKRQGNFGVGRSRKPGFLELCSPLQGVLGMSMGIWHSVSTSPLAFTGSWSCFAPFKPWNHRFPALPIDTGLPPPWSPHRKHHVLNLPLGLLVRKRDGGRRG